MQCPESLRVQAYFDGEADALTSAGIKQHLERCVECRALISSLEKFRGALRRKMPDLAAPAALRRQVLQALDAQPVDDTARPRNLGQSPIGRRLFWWGAVSGLGTAAAMATVAYFVLALPFANPVVDELLGAHVSSLKSGRLVEVASTDQHTVKPWFAGRADVAPVVADFANQGYPLSGGRVDPIGHQRAAVMVYRHGAHVINVFCWAATRAFLPASATRHGYHVVFWRSGDLAYAAVSDVARDELLGMERLVQGRE